MKSIQEIEAGLELDGDEDIVRAQLATANARIAELERQQSEPFGYFKAEPFGWTDCAETDDGAKALYERPDPRVAELERVQGVLVEALEKIRDLDGTEDNEWDGVERVMPLMAELASYALAAVRQQLAESEEDNARLRSEWIAPSELQSAIEQAVAPYRKDVEDWGGALNDASWKLIETFPGGMTGYQFNNCKASLRAAIQAYFESIDAALSAKEKSNG